MRMNVAPSLESAPTAAASTQWEVTAATAMKALKSAPLAQSVSVITMTWWVLSSLFVVAGGAFQVLQDIGGEFSQVNI